VTDQERAAAGAAVLDEVAPGWYEKVIPARISVASGIDCPLGQRYGSYAAGRATVAYHLGLARLPGTYATDHGFFGATPELDAAWRDEVVARKIRATVAHSLGG